MLKYFRGRSFGYIFRFVLATPLALIFWLCMEIITIFRPVYIVGLSYKGRITQYMAPMELHLRQANQTKKKYLMIFVMPAATPNEAVRTVYSRYALIIDSRHPVIIRSAFGTLSVLLKRRFTPELQGWQYLWQLEPATALTNGELKFGYELRHNLGIPKDAQYVCLGVKEAAYYASITPESGYGQDLSHQVTDSRNVDITNYMLAATSLADLGLYVIRMGSVVTSPLPKDRHPLIIDYATDARSELGDLFLGANCKFFICGVTGSWIFAGAQNRPIAYIDHYFENSNYSPTKRLDQLPNSILIHRMYSDRSNNFLTFKSIIDSNIGLLQDVALNKLEITPRANTPTEILEAVLELNCRIDSDYRKTIDEEFLQDKFYDCFVPPFPWRDYQLMRVANSFLRKYQDLL
jgi:putative glycosyltransferase (TIGR04372 family)